MCVKDGKKFISEQKVFSKDEIKEHNLYGDIDEDIPPHTKCPFCGDLYYNDEFLYKHMSNSHFMCEICKSMDKTIIFYSALPNLIQHNKLYHYCCPFKECQDVLYIAFSTRKQLIQHFENKHNQKNKNLNEKMADENKPRITEDPTLYDISMKKDEFNFTNFLEKLNKRCIQHRENKNKTNNEENSNTIENNNNTNYPKLNMDGVEIIYKYPKYEDYKYFQYKVNDKIIQIQIWDTYGKDEFALNTPNLFKNTSVAILVYAINDKKTFQDIQNWYYMILNHSFDHIIFLIGNKCDLKEERKVTIEDAETYKNNYDDIKMIFETSAKTGENMDKLLENIVISIYEKNEKEEKAKKEEKNLEKTKTIKLVKENHKKRRKKKWIC